MFRLGKVVFSATACALCLLAPSVAAADELTVTSWGGAYQESQRLAYFEPFSASSGSSVREEEYSGELSKISAMVKAGAVTWDVVDVDSYTATQGCDDGVLERIDYSKVLPEAKFVGGTTFECGVPTVIFSTVLAYDTERLTDGPKTIADLFDLSKFPGKRALQRNPVANLEFALVADGVAPGDVYDVLRTEEGIERAFRKLDTIKDEVIWWETGAQPPQLLASGAVVMSTAWNGRIYDANKNEGRKFKIVWDGQVQDWNIWAIPRGTPNLDLAYKFLEFATSAEQQALQTTFISYSPMNQDAMPLVDADILPDLPSAPDNIANAVKTDAVFWADNGDDLRKRFANWLASN